MKIKRMMNIQMGQSQVLEQVALLLREAGYPVAAPHQIPDALEDLVGRHRTILVAMGAPTGLPAVAGPQVPLQAPVAAPTQVQLPAVAGFHHPVPLAAPVVQSLDIGGFDDGVLCDFDSLFTGPEATAVPGAPGAPGATAMLDPALVEARLQNRLARARTDGIHYGTGGGGLGRTAPGAPEPAPKLPLDEQRRILSQVLGKPVQEAAPPDARQAAIRAQM
jgi:hypothetical protein